MKVNILSKKFKKKYSIIYADPPWSYKDKANGTSARGGAEIHYPTMNIKDICNLPVDKISNKNSILFMWCTWPMLQEGLKLIEAWGFTFKTIGFVWVKANKKANVDEDPFKPFFGLGRYTRSNTEFCLIATKGKGIKRKSAKVHQVIYSPIEGHSKKPSIARDKIIELCGDVTRVELFARQKHKGWDHWGNEL